jgi:hypothetical protein
MGIATTTTTVRKRRTTTRMKSKKARNQIEGTSRVKKDETTEGHQHHANVLEGVDGDNLINPENELP